MGNHSTDQGSEGPSMLLILYIRSGSRALPHADAVQMSGEDLLLCHLCRNIAWEDGTDTDAIVA